MPKTVIFDFFDVIHKDHQKAWFKKHGFTRAGSFAEASDLLDIGKIDYTTYIKQLSKASGLTAHVINKEFAEYAVLDEETVALIQELRDVKLSTALLSNSSTDEIRPIIERHALQQLFDVIVISGEVKLAKPDPRIFEYMLGLLAIKPEQAIFIDDSERNILVARQLGINVIHHIDATSTRRKLVEFGILNPLTVTEKMSV